MAKLCPACSKANPAAASYCFYDGRHLSPDGREGPLQIGAMPLPMPFYFPDGQSCANFNQLALACDARWDEARGLLADGTWHSFFCTIGRLDLAAAAKQAGREPDLDLGLSQLLEKIPTDPNVLRRPQLSLPSAEEDLGALTPGTDRRFELMITNRGLLVLRGMATTNCEWLSLGDGAGSALKMFQTRGIYTLPVRVLGNKLRASAKPLQGDIVIDTNGGAITVPVRADVPIRPFPGGRPANDVLAGVKSPRQLALKAKANPLGAGALFEQGAVKAWYESNGWVYPVQGTQASGKAAVQQYFEALGLTKPPRLEIDAERLLCQGEPGQRLTKHVTISTPEPRVVYAHAWSNQPWIKGGPGKPQGNKTTIPLQIEVPTRPGETVHADVTIQGNGRQQFVVPVTLAVSTARASVDDDEAGPTRRLPLSWILGAAGLLLTLAVGVAVLVKSALHPAIPPTTVSPNVTTVPPPPTYEAWWAGIPDTNLTDSVLSLKAIAPQDQAIFDGIAAKNDMERGAAYEKLAAELPKLLGDPKAKEPLSRLFAECCVFETSGLCMAPLRQALTSQIPQEAAPFQPDRHGEELERGLWSLKTIFGALAHKAIRRENAGSLELDLGRVLGDALDVKGPRDKLKEQSEQALSERCYRNTLPTATLSMEYALAMRHSLIERFPQHLTPAFRAPTDVALLDKGLSNGNDAWPGLEEIMNSCLKSTDPAVAKKVIDLYEKAAPAAAQKMEPLLATKWKDAGDANATRAEKAQALRDFQRLADASARISPETRIARLQKLTSDALSSVAAEEKKETVLLRDAVRLAHASMRACALFHKDDGEERLIQFDDPVKRFPVDDLVKRISDVDQPDQKNLPDKVDNEKTPAPKGKVVGDKGIQEKPRTLKATDKPDPAAPGYVCTEYSYNLKAGQSYTFSLRRDVPYARLRLEDAKGGNCCQAADDIGLPRLALNISYPPPEDGDYKVIVSIPSGKGEVLLLAQKGFVAFGGGPFFGPRGFGPGMMPGGVAPPQPAPPAKEKKDKQLNLSALDKLASKKSTERVAAFEDLADSDLNDLKPLDALKIAKYLLAIDTEDELENVKPKLETFGECRPLLLALADLVGDEEKKFIKEERAEAIVGGVLARPLEVPAGKEWRTACRRMLMQHALDMTRNGMIGADQAADILRDLYKEQGRAFGVEAPDFFELTRPTEVLERVIKHAATKAARRNPAAEDGEYLGQIDRNLQAARFIAENDLEHMVLLQRIWIKVLRLYVQAQAPDHAERMEQICKGLVNHDRRSSGALDQLRAGEEAILRIWALADHLNPK